MSPIKTIRQIDGLFADKENDRLTFTLSQNWVTSHTIAADALYGELWTDVASESVEEIMVEIDSEILHSLQDNE